MCRLQSLFSSCCSLILQRDNVAVVLSNTVNPKVSVPSMLPVLFYCYSPISNIGSGTGYPKYSMGEAVDQRPRIFFIFSTPRPLLARSRNGFAHQKATYCRFGNEQ